MYVHRRCILTYRTYTQVSSGSINKYIVTLDVSMDDMVRMQKLQAWKVCKYVCTECTYENCLSVLAMNVHISSGACICTCVTTHMYSMYHVM